MSLSDIPILILTFNRPYHFNKCLENLNESKIKKIYISIDGPRNKDDKEKQDQILNAIAENKKKFDFQINLMRKNYGCKDAVNKGLDWFFKKVSKGIILEDDVSISRNCLNSFIYLLDKYENSSNIMSISSHNEYISFDDSQILLMSPVWRAWGWAGWSDKWFKHREFSKKVQNFSITKIKKLFPLDYQNLKNAKLIKECQFKYIDTWDYEYNFSHLALNLFSLTISGINCINFGFDQFATHTLNKKNNLYEELINFPIDNKKIIKMSESDYNKTIKITGFKKFKPNHFVIDFTYSKFISLIIFLKKLKRNLALKK